MKRVSLVIRGRVQGVFYRASARARAEELGLTGWVRNREDGAVEAVAEGPDDRVDAFVRWCGQGPPGARVEGVDLEPGEATGELATFTVKR